jgi:hypothetical protein
MVLASRNVEASDKLETKSIRHDKLERGEAGSLNSIDLPVPSRTKPRQA